MRSSNNHTAQLCPLDIPEHFLTMRSQKIRKVCLNKATLVKKLKCYLQYYNMYDTSNQIRLQKRCIILCCISSRG